MTTVPVFIVPDPVIDIDAYHLNQRTRRLFTNPLFDIKEVENIDAALHLCPKESYCIIVHNTSISALSPEELASYVGKALELKESFDFCYLAYWEDKCQLYTERKIIDTEGYVLARTQGPRGTQCILISARGRAAFSKASESIPSLIQKGTLVAYCFSPPLAYFDLEYAVDNNDYNKRNQCLLIENSVPRTIKITNGNESVTTYWLLGFLIIVIIVTIVVRR